MSKAQPETIYDCEYKCRRCGQIFNDGSDKYPEHGHGYCLWIDELMWTRDERESYHRKLSSMAGTQYTYPDMPPPFRTHRCEDDNIGIGDIIGYVNRRQRVKKGRGWQLITEG